MADKPLDVLHDPAARRAFESHPRSWQANRYVYPVVSRRSKGISIGVNLNPDKVCNFDCIYCCVDRTTPLPKDFVREVDLRVLRAELAEMLEVVGSGEIFRFDPFDKVPAALRRVNDVAFSGDGEPTSCGNFMGASEIAAELLEKQEAGSKTQEEKPIKIVVITNATLFHQERVREALAFLDQHHGEIWAKLDAGTEGYYQEVDRTAVPFGRVLENLLWCCRTRATVIQSLFMRVRGEAPPAAEVEAYVGRLRDIVAGGGTIKLVQLYTVARRTTESYATPLTEAELDGIATRVRAGLVGVAVEVYP